MCDHRNPPEYYIDLSDGSAHPIKYGGFIGMDLHVAKERKEPMVYLTGASGVGYNYWDGEKFIDCYDDKRFKFVFHDKPYKYEKYLRNWTETTIELELGGQNND